MNTKLPGIVIILLVAVFGGWALNYDYTQTLQKNLGSQISQLQSQVAGLSSRLAGQATSTQSQLAALSQNELSNRQQVVAKSQDQLLTEAVAKVTPSVVSIIISKDVPQYSVTYVNPFGDDPNFKDFGIQMPVYTQNGTQNQEVGAGTGFIISSDGYILTNKHVVSDDSASYTVLLANAKQMPAKIIYKDPDNDLAIIKIDGSGYKAVNLGDSSSLQLGQSVFAVGNALGQYNNSVSVGVIAGLNRTIDASDAQSGTTETLNGVIQTDAAINPGNSGGPLADLNGNAIGINVATTQGANNISFSIPINQVKAIVKRVLGK